MVDSSVSVLHPQNGSALRRSDGPEHPAELNAKVLSALARWIVKHHGEAKLNEMAETVGFEASEIDGATRWLSMRQCDQFLLLARGLVADDQAFVRACGEQFYESMGAFRYMARALSVRPLLETAAKLSKMMLRVSRYEVLSAGRSSFSIRYTSERPESRLMCLSRQASWIYSPTMWGLPVAQITEEGCIANGDPCCVYHLKWFERSRLFPALLGLGIGIAVAMLFGGLRHSGAATVAFGLLGAAVGHILELRRTSAANLAFAQSLNDVLRQVSEDEVSARSEIVALQQRQREWIRLMEQQVTERTTTLEKIVEGLDGLQQNRVSTIRGFSHDLRNPLFVVRGNTQFLRETIQGGDAGEALKDMETAAIQIETMLSRLMEVATAESGFVKLDPRPVAIAPLADIFRRRLRALVHGRDIKVSVFSTHEAPGEVLIDPLVFDRVVDNLLTNAAKYTDRGSILLEISGTPESLIAPHAESPPVTADQVKFLTLRLSDTGLGIAPEQVERIFRPRPSDEPARRPNSYGIGLSSVVRLLGQIGGHLDVMSKAGVGTTFWAHFPTVPPTKRPIAAGDDNLENMIKRVVTIRKADSV